MFEYDTIAARFHPGGNTGTKKSYYTESPLQNWVDLVGDKFRFYEGFIQLKNRAPHLLWKEILLSIKIDKKVLIDPKFWLFALTSLLLPAFILKPLTNFYRHRVERMWSDIIYRPRIHGPKEGRKGGKEWSTGCKKGIF